MSASKETVTMKWRNSRQLSSIESFVELKLSDAKGVEPLSILPHQLKKILEVVRQAKHTEEAHGE